MACCLRAFSIGDVDVTGRADKTKINRYKCVEILLRESKAALETL